MKRITLSTNDRSYITICHVCLSRDRQLFSVEEYEEIFQNICDNKLLTTLLCWECAAMLRKIKQFKDRAELSTKILKKYLNGQYHKIDSLSNLKICENYAIEIIDQIKCEKTDDDIGDIDIDDIKIEDNVESHNDEHAQNEEQTQKPITNLLLEEIRPQIDIKQELNLDDDGFDDEDNTDNFENNQGNFDEKSPVTCKEADKKKPIKRYRMISNSMNDFKSLVRRVCLNTDEVKSYIVMERLNKLYTDLEFKCSWCAYSWKNENKLVQHNKKYHLKTSGKYQCDFCLCRFARKTNLVLHIRRHFTVFECCECSYRSYRPLMKKHLKGHNRIVECLKCKASFSNIYLFHQHHKDLHVIFVCDICGKKSRSKKILESHISRHYETFECKLCNRTYKTKSTFKRHQEEKHSPASGDDYCVKCDKKFASPSVYRRHIVRSAAHAAERDGDRTAYGHTMADQPGQTMDLTDLLLPSRSIVLTEAQDAAASTSVTPFAEPPTIAAKKSKAQKQREYRRRIAAARTPDQVIAARKADAERQRNFRLRKADNSVFVSDSLESTTASSSRSGASSNDVQTGTHPAQYTVQPGTSSDQIEVKQAQSTWNTKWASSIMRFESTFLENDFGYACSVCDRLWCKNELKPITAAQLEVISEWFIKEKRQLCREEYQMVCNSCKRTLNKKTMPLLAKVNGFSYPDQPPGLPPLDPISERLISPCLPFMQVRRLRHDSSYGIIGQVINVPVDVQEMAKCLPRQLNEDDVINVNIERNLAHNSVYISGYLSKSTISAWLNELQKSPLYRLYEIDVDLSRLHPTVPFLDDIQDDPSNRIENISAENTPESEILASRQHTMMWHEEDCLNIAPGHQAKPLDIIYDRHAEELSFPSIYFGEPRRFNMRVSLTPDMIATSEIRRRDRRGATPQKILYVAMKILRLRMVNGIYSTFRNVSVTKNVTRRMLEEETEFLKEYVIQNLALMKTVPNSVQYWASRKRDLFAMIRQLGKPTVFLTISANEIHWMKLLTILLKLSKKYPGKTAKDLNTSERCTLVSDDPVTCCVYFYKLVGSLMKMLKSKQTYNPFGKYFVKDYFLRIEFQHQGSPQAHILLWLNDDPRETVSENMPRTIDLVEKISSVARDDVPNNSIYANQIHEHTLTCTKQGETTCRFRVPYWPMDTTRVLVPIPQSDGRRQTLQQKAKELRTSLGERSYACMDDFLNANGMTYVSYLDIVRSTLSRPTLVFRRNFDELMTNTFNPYLAGEVNSNIDIQFILDDYSCAEYVVEYVNKAARGMGDLRRELTTMMQEHPEQDYTGQLKALSIKLLNAVEMSAQEAAWFLLRQPMSETSRHVVYIPTVWPSERQCCRKLRQQMDREGISGDSTDVWTKNIIQRYEERPASLEQVYLAEFASWYANFNDFVDEEDDVHMDDDEDSEAVPEARKSRAPKEYRRRLLGRVIRYRRYDIDETVDYKREMVLLFVQFRNEISEIVDQNKFLQLFDDNKDMIMERRSLFETNLNFENVMKELV